MKSRTNAALQQDLTSEQKLQEFRAEAQVIVEPRYHEFHRDVSRFGFSKITIPRKKI